MDGASKPKHKPRSGIFTADNKRWIISTGKYFLGSFFPLPPDHQSTEQTLKALPSGDEYYVEVLKQLCLNGTRQQEFSASKLGLLELIAKLPVRYRLRLFADLTRGGKDFTDVESELPCFVVDTLAESFLGSHVADNLKLCLDFLQKSIKYRTKDFSICQYSGVQRDLFTEIWGHLRTILTTLTVPCKSINPEYIPPLVEQTCSLAETILHRWAVDRSSEVVIDFSVALLKFNFELPPNADAEMKSKKRKMLTSLETLFCHMINGNMGFSLFSKYHKDVGRNTDGPDGDDLIALFTGVVHYFGMVIKQDNTPSTATNPEALSPVLKKSIKYVFEFYSRIARHIAKYLDDLVDMEMDDASPTSSVVDDDQIVAQHGESPRSAIMPIGGDAELTDTAPHASSTVTTLATTTSGEDVTPVENQRRELSRQATSVDKNDNRAEMVLCVITARKSQQHALSLARLCLEQSDDSRLSANVVQKRMALEKQRNTLFRSFLYCQSSMCDFIRETLLKYRPGICTTQKYYIEVLTAMQISFSVLRIEGQRLANIVEQRHTGDFEQWERDYDAACQHFEQAAIAAHDFAMKAGVESLNGTHYGMYTVLQPIVVTTRNRPSAGPDERPDIGRRRHFDVIRDETFVTYSLRSTIDVWFRSDQLHDLFSTLLSKSMKQSIKMQALQLFKEVLQHYLNSGEHLPEVTPCGNRPDVTQELLEEFASLCKKEKSFQTQILNVQRSLFAVYKNRPLAQKHILRFVTGCLREADVTERSEDLETVHHALTFLMEAARTCLRETLLAVELAAAVDAMLSLLRSSDLSRAVAKRLLTFVSTIDVSAIGQLRLVSYDGALAKCAGPGDNYTGNEAYRAWFASRKEGITALNIFMVPGCSPDEQDSDKDTPTNERSEPVKDDTMLETPKERTNSSNGTNTSEMSLPLETTPKVNAKVQSREGETARCPYSGYVIVDKIFVGLGSLLGDVMELTGSKGKKKDKEAMPMSPADFEVAIAVLECSRKLGLRPGLVHLCSTREFNTGLVAYLLNFVVRRSLVHLKPPKKEKKVSGRNVDDLYQPPVHQTPPPASTVAPSAVSQATEIDVEQQCIALLEKATFLAIELAAIIMAYSSKFVEQKNRAADPCNILRVLYKLTGYQEQFMRHVFHALLMFSYNFWDDAMVRFRPFFFNSEEDYTMNDPLESTLTKHSSKNSTLKGNSRDLAGSIELKKAIKARPILPYISCVHSNQNFADQLMLFFDIFLESPNVVKLTQEDFKVIICMISPYIDVSRFPTTSVAQAFHLLVTVFVRCPHSFRNIVGTNLTICINKIIKNVEAVRQNVPPGRIPVSTEDHDFFQDMCKLLTQFCRSYRYPVRCLPQNPYLPTSTAFRHYGIQAASIGSSRPPAKSLPPKPCQTKQVDDSKTKVQDWVDNNAAQASSYAQKHERSGLMINTQTTDKDEEGAAVAGGDIVSPSTSECTTATVEGLSSTGGDETEEADGRPKGVNGDMSSPVGSVSHSQPEQDNEGSDPFAQSGSSVALDSVLGTSINSVGPLVVSQRNGDVTATSQPVTQQQVVPELKVEEHNRTDDFTNDGSSVLDYERFHQDVKLFVNLVDMRIVGVRRLPRMVNFGAEFEVAPDDLDADVDRVKRRRYAAACRRRRVARLSRYLPKAYSHVGDVANIVYDESSSEEEGQTPTVGKRAKSVKSRFIANSRAKGLYHMNEHIDDRLIDASMGILMPGVDTFEVVVDRPVGISMYRFSLPLQSMFSTLPSLEHSQGITSKFLQDPRRVDDLTPAELEICCICYYLGGTPNEWWRLPVGIDYFPNTNMSSSSAMRSHDIDTTLRTSLVCLRDMLPAQRLKFGVLYVGPGQCSRESLVLLNTSGSMRYQSFLDKLAVKFRMNEAMRRFVYLAGLTTATEDVDQSGNAGIEEDNCGDYVYVHTLPNSWPASKHRGLLSSFLSKRGNVDQLGYEDAVSATLHGASTNRSLFDSGDNYSITVFHVATMMPSPVMPRDLYDYYSRLGVNDTATLDANLSEKKAKYEMDCKRAIDNKKRHIGNDQVIIVYNDDPTEQITWTNSILRSQFHQVMIVIQPQLAAVPTACDPPTMTDPLNFVFVLLRPDMKQQYVDMIVGKAFRWPQPFIVPDSLLSTTVRAIATACHFTLQSAMKPISQSHILVNRLRQFRKIAKLANERYSASGTTNVLVTPAQSAGGGPPVTGTRSSLSFAQVVSNSGRNSPASKPTTASTARDSQLSAARIVSRTTSPN